MLHVADTDAACSRHANHGATVEREIYENHGTRNATIIDPFGHRWMLSGPLTLTAGIRHGDIGYVSVWTPDADRAAAFYGHVLGWTYDPATHQVTNTELPTGISASAGHADPVLLLRGRRSAERRARRSREAGGMPGRNPATRSYGTLLDATDPQGAAFAVYEPAGGPETPGTQRVRAGELSYVTYEVPDSAGVPRLLRPSAAAGPSNLAGWRTAGRWRLSIRWPAPPAAARVRATVPMWTVADIDAAVTRVREAGGTVLAEPSRQPYGVTAECTDDQGAPLSEL